MMQSNDGSFVANAHAQLAEAERQVCKHVLCAIIESHHRGGRRAGRGRARTTQPGEVSR
jgi:hypothetical protein